MKIIGTIVLILAVVGYATADTHAVIVAGSNQYYNYRHQADACHAYITLRKGGIPAENIILFAYNDIAHSSSNPFPGKIFNKPDGDDVYEGCVIDYQGADVTPELYLAVLRGDKNAVAGHGTERVLTSSKNDLVFLNFADHGAPGLIAFPSTYLYANQLIPVLTAMQKAGKFAKLVYYLEACESGSMFVNLPSGLNIYALTAANPTESSWGTYCPPQDKVQGKSLGTCLGDLFSVNWLENTDATDTSKQTLEQQYNVVKTLTAQSHVMQYGDLSFTTEASADFVGNQHAKVESEDLVNARKSIVDSRDIKLHYLINKHSNELTINSMNELNVEILDRKFFDDVFSGIEKFIQHNGFATNTDFECYQDLINFYELNCGKFSDYGMKYMRSFYDACDNKENVDFIGMKAYITKTCIGKTEAF